MKFKMKMILNHQTNQLLQKLNPDFSDAPRESLNQTIKTNNPFMQLKLPEDSLGQPSIINLIKQTWIRLACNELLLWINDIVHRQDARPLIEIKSNPMMVGKSFFDKGAGLTCIYSQQFRLIPIDKRPRKLNLNQREARGASETVLIQDS